MKIYIAAPLFNEMELKRNLSIDKVLKGEGFKTYLPQRDGGLFYDFKNQEDQVSEIRKQIFLSDYEAIIKCDIILCLLDGRVLDEGMCIEIGIAFALKKICLGYKTDYRCQDKFGNNIMIEGTLSKIFKHEEDLLKHLRKISVTHDLLSCAV